MTKSKNKVSGNAGKPTQTKTNKTNAAAAKPGPKPTPLSKEQKKSLADAAAANTLLGHFHGHSGVRGPSASRLLSLIESSLDSPQRRAVRNASLSDLEVVRSGKPSLLGSALATIAKMYGIDESAVNATTFLINEVSSGDSVTRSIVDWVSSNVDTSTLLGSAGPSAESCLASFKTGSSPVGETPPYPGDEDDARGEIPVQPPQSGALSLGIPALGAGVTAGAAYGEVLGGNHTSLSALQTPYGAGIRVVGRQPLAVLLWGATAGTTYAKLTSMGATVGPGNNTILLGPQYIGGRLSTLAALYERWHPHSLKIKYSPVCPTNYTGAYAHAISEDADTYSTHTAGVDYSETLTFEVSGGANVWAPSELENHMNGMGSWLFTSETSLGTGGGAAGLRQICAGAYMCHSNIFTPGSLENYPLGSIILEYDVMLAAPQPEAPMTLTGSMAKYLGSGFSAGLAEAISQNPVPLYRMMREYCLSPNAPEQSPEDERIEAYLERRGIVPKLVLTGFQKWSLETKRSSSESVSDKPNQTDTRSTPQQQQLLRIGNPLYVQK